ncbi:hypothetical protein J6590_107062 [Homalodisca vitripennis]|nr:hypothetical protein J6590_107062 [Homalodisca vitripennis]
MDRCSWHCHILMYAQFGRLRQLSVQGWSRADRPGADGEAVSGGVPGACDEAGSEVAAMVIKACA